MSSDRQVYCLPYDLFEIDHAEQKNAPAAVAGVPIYNYGKLQAVFPLAARLGEILAKPAVPKTIVSNNGVVVRFNSQSTDLAFKFRKGSSSAPVADFLKETKSIKNSYGGFSTVNYAADTLDFNNEYWNPLQASKSSLVEVAAANIAHRLEPAFFPGPHGLWALDSKFVSFSSRFLEGKFGPSILALSYAYGYQDEVSRQGFNDALGRVRDYGIIIDDDMDFAANFVATKVNGRLVPQVIDLYLSDLSLLDKPLPNM